MNVIDRRRVGLLVICAVAVAEVCVESLLTAQSSVDPTAELLAELSVSKA